MKRVKKLFAVLLAAMTVMALSATALAAETFTIRFTDPGFSLFGAGDGTPRYSVYQIFTGDVSTDETTNVRTLSNIKWGKNAKNYSEGEAVSEDVLNALKAVNVPGKSDKEKLDVITPYVNLDSEPIKKTDGTSDDDTSVKPGYYLIKDNGPVSNNETYSLYLVEVTDDVTIKPKSSDTTSEKNIVDNNTEKKSADYDIGSEITFRLSATITEHYDYYESYKLTFHDTLSKGLTLGENPTVTVKVDGTEIANSNYTLVTTGLTDGCSLEVQFEDLKDIANVAAKSEITVEYTATLNEDAVIGGDGNTNTLKVSYSNNPYNKDDTTYTPDVTVTVYTYKIVVNKVDENDAALANATFTLSKNADGTNPIEFVETADNTYRLAVEGETDTVTDFTTDSTGTFTLQGLASGMYYLKETAAPSGYNTLAEPVTVNISDSGTVTVGNGTVGVDAVKVENKAGSILPETGGIGTTIFYVLGGILMAGAVVLLVTRKRMRDAE